MYVFKIFYQMEMLALKQVVVLILFNNHLLSACSVLGTFLGSGS